MDHQLVRNKLLDFVENVLPAQLSADISAHLAECSECRDVYKQYRSIVSLEQAVQGGRVPCLTEDLSGAVMAQIARIERSEIVPRELRMKARWVVGSLLSMNAVLVVMLALLVRNTYFSPVRAVLPGVTGFGAGDERQFPAEMYSPAAYRGSAAAAPLGYRPVALNLESPNGLEQLTRPDALVDVKCAYKESGERREALVSQLVRVLSANLLNSPNPQSRQSVQTVTVTLLVPEGDAKRIELARLLGQLSLSVITPKTEAERRERSIFTLYDPEGRPVTDEAGPNTVAVMYEPDPKTGSQTRRVFVDGKWRDEKGLELLAF